MMSSPCLDAEVPSSERSKAVAARIEPRLAEELAKTGLSLGSPVYLRIFKEPGTLELWIRKADRFALFKTYSICTFSGTLGPKLKEGDQQAPEGCYVVNAGRMNPSSKFHLSFDLGYPNAYDRAQGRTGSLLMVHGNCVSIGCYAMGNESIEEIWTLCSRALHKGQESFHVHCFPFPLSEENLAKQAENEWIQFWKELQPVYASFETHKLPPEVAVRDGKYALLDQSE
jgi:murein L,D-transpeptidase YafK